jgi:hypothetical protein
VEAKEIPKNDMRCLSILGNQGDVFLIETNKCEGDIYCQPASAEIIQKGSLRPQCNLDAGKQGGVHCLACTDWQSWGLLTFLV